MRQPHRSRGRCGGRHRCLRLLRCHHCRRRDPLAGQQAHGWWGGRGRPLGAASGGAAFFRLNGLTACYLGGGERCATAAEDAVAAAPLSVAVRCGGVDYGGVGRTAALFITGHPPQAAVGGHTPRAAATTPSDPSPRVVPPPPRRDIPSTRRVAAPSPVRRTPSSPRRARSRPSPLGRAVHARRPHCRARRHRTPPQAAASPPPPVSESSLPPVPLQSPPPPRRPPRPSAQRRCSPSSRCSRSLKALLPVV